MTQKAQKTLDFPIIYHGQCSQAQKKVLEFLPNLELYIHKV